MAGAMAGMAEHCIMYPIDSVKTRMQSLCPCPERACPTPVHGLMSIMKREGWWRPLRGVNAIFVSAGPAHALYFSIYEKTKHMLTGGKSGHHNSLAYGAAGCIATVVHDAVMNPAEGILFLAPPKYVSLLQ
uniref:Uncharacterized protein n=1 Tax=Plectus sambesii TaxID=2011161 RepID=A0A914VE00_9BILA